MTLLRQSKNDCGIRQYLCWSETAEAHYVALSMFHDVFGQAYTKPIYIEKNSATAELAGRCKEGTLFGRPFYSLIKSPNGIYRFNQTIYEDSHRILKLPFESHRSLAFGLMITAPLQIRDAYDPFRACEEAQINNPDVEAAVSFLTNTSTVSEDSLALIGSTSMDPTLKARDIDLVFTGDISTLDLAYRWVRQGPSEGPRLRRHLPPPLPTICSFFSANPVAYPDLSNFEVQSATLKEFDLILGGPLSPPYLNIQTYSAMKALAHREIVLIVRDTLSRDTLEPGKSLSGFGYPSVIGGRQAILVTDVERQLPKVSFHGGGTKFEFPNGVSK